MVFTAIIDGKVYARHGTEVLPRDLKALGLIVHLRTDVMSHQANNPLTILRGLMEKRDRFWRLRTAPWRRIWLDHWHSVPIHATGARSSRRDQRSHGGKDAKTHDHDRSGISILPQDDGALRPGDTPAPYPSSAGPDAA